jgi:hypothetical protein
MVSSLYVFDQSFVCIAPMRATCFTHFVEFHWMILIMSGEGLKLCSFLQPPVTSSLLVPRVLLSTWPQVQNKIIQRLLCGFTFTAISSVMSVML